MKDSQSLKLFVRSETGFGNKKVKKSATWLFFERFKDRANNERKHVEGVWLSYPDRDGQAQVAKRNSGTG
ncbi:hypothetical protein [Ruegeria lacuscaerulensis]|uniref:hypothetical protein n=1 Tax=Ruegeria lacuscaerulensis TaxID=55218 RepID=UPI00147EEB86|nr:hypothetical protein [Ruegeria lacuscaerulensis]